jgi:hypothetical protein
LTDCSEDIKEELRAWIRGSGRVRIDLLLTAAANHPNVRFIEELCALLALKNPKVPDEGIVDILFKIPSPKAVPCLTEALSRRYDYDMYDEFNVKCLDTLAAIGTADAYAAIERALSSTSERIRMRAQELTQGR